jgi:diguanylate cyclase (GGDEF)-like protein
MQIQYAFLKSKVAKRIFILFIVAAIIPVSIMGVITYQYVTKLLTEKEHKHLTLESKSYGMAIFDRILVAESQMIGFSEYLVQNIENIETYEKFIEKSSNKIQLFNNIKVYSNDHDNNNNAYKHLLGGNTKITTSTYNDNIVITFSRLINTIDSTLILSAEVNTNYIFGDMDKFAGDDDACVIAQGVGTLNCSNSVFNIFSLPSFARYLDEQTTSHTININNIDYVISSWELFLNGNFNTESWLIYYTTPKSTLLTSIKSFSNQLIPALLLTILLVSLISINQITRLLIPLEKLSYLTKRISKRKFNEDVKFESGDEFQQLGESFNKMSFELSRQFTVMTAMSHLDRAILANMSKKTVVEAIFENLEDYLEYDHASVILLDHNNDPNSNLYTYSKTEKRIISNNLLNVTNEDIDTLLGHTDSYVRTQDHNKLKMIDWLKDIHSNYITTIAVKEKSKTSALIIIGHQFLPQLDREGMEQLDNYTDRVRVALNAIEREEKLIQQANYDDLTGLPNRQLLIDTFNQLSSKQNTSQKTAILFIDLDKFKIINDTQGHAIGDKLLKEASSRIQSCVNTDAFLARYGGDEFVILLPIENDTSNITNICNEIINQISKLFSIDNYEQYIGASIGVSLYPKDGNNWNDVLQKADIAMYKAKEKGRNTALYFSDSMQEEISEKASLEADLFHALEKQEIYMVYQPQMDIATGEIVGAETLMRWKHGSKGNIRPDKFISYAEDNGYVIPLGIWALRNVLQQCSDWQLENQSLPKISINISPRQLRHTSFINEVEAIISDFDMHSTNIEFEITESLFLNNDVNILDKLHHLNKLGISISIDDFGKGYSSLSYLKHLPVQTLKIDKLFIDDIHKDDQSLAIVKAIIVMAKSLNKTVIAEGIEKVEQLNVLKEIGCDIAQGYLISKPKLAKDVMNYSKTAIINLDDFRDKILSS